MAFIRAGIDFISSLIMTMQGIRNKIITVAKIIPVASEITIGIKKRACILVSMRIGNNPRLVVSVVNKIGLKRRAMAVIIAS